MRLIKVYLSGPITGMTDENREAFASAEAELQTLNFLVLNPHRLGIPRYFSWESCMRACLAQLLACDAVYLLSGWQDSRGALIENELAGNLDIPRFVTVPALVAWRDGLKS